MGKYTGKQVVPITPHNVVLTIPLTPRERLLTGVLAERLKNQDPRYPFWEGWKLFCQREFGKVRYRRWMDPKAEKHNTFETDDVEMQDGQAPERLRFQFQNFNDALVMGMMLGIHGQTDPTVLLRRALYEYGEAILGKPAARKIMGYDHIALPTD